MDEITKLVAEYNEAERQQSARRVRLFNLIKARQGWRYVKFSLSPMWANVWETATPETVTAKMENTITEVVEGQA